MNAESRPAKAAPEVHAGGLNSFDSTAVRRYPAQIVLTDVAETWLENLAVDLCLGRVELRQLSPALLALYTAAYEHGRTSRDLDIASLEALADRHYLRAYNSPAKIREIQQRAIDGAAAESARRFFGEAA